MKRKISLIITIIMISNLLLSGCDSSISCCNEKVVTVSGYIEEGTFDINVDSGITVSLIKKIEDETYSFITETKSGKAISKAFAVLKDGSEKTIDNFESFLIDSDIISFRVETENAISIDSFMLTPNSFEGYYLGNSYTVDLQTHIEPDNATNKKIKFFSSNSSVATVNSNGKVKIIGSGTATISAITLDGGLKSTCTIMIQDGTVTLKDTLGYADFKTASLIGNRYDEESDQTSEFSCIAYSEQSNTVIVGGNAKYDDQRNFGIIAYGIPSSDGESFKGRYQIDPENKYANDYVKDIIFHRSSMNYYVLSHVSDGKSNDLKMMICIYDEKWDDVMNEYILSLSEVIVLTTENEYSKMFVASNEIYCIGRNKKGSCIVDVYNTDFEYIKTNTYSNLTLLTDGVYDEQSGRIVAVGKGENDASALIVLDTKTGKEYFGYSSVVSNASLTGVSIIDDLHYVVSGNGTINNKSIGFVELFVLNEDNNNCTSINHLKLESKSTSFGDLQLSGIVYSKGVICVTGYEKENMTHTYSIFNTDIENASCSGFLQKSKSEEYVCGIVISLNTELKAVSALKYFNSQENTGKKQYFYKSMMMPNGNLICVGKSNYNLNGELFNGYIQCNVGIMEK